MNLKNLFRTEPNHLNCTQAVKWHLENYGSITQLQCINKYGSWKLSRIIGDLGRQGIKVETELKEVETQFGFKSRVAIYHIIR